MANTLRFQYDVFISYSHHDEGWVWQQLLPQLENHGLNVCMDRRDFEIGTPQVVNMEQAIDASHHTLLVLTPAWLENEWLEFQSLLVASVDPAGRQRRLFPVILKSCELPLRLRSLTPADFTIEDEFVDQFARLVQQLRLTMKAASDAPHDRAPFVAGPPLTHPRSFYGREYEIKRLFGLLRRPPLQNAALIGPRRSGKTSLLLYLKQITTTPRNQLRPDQNSNWLPEPARYRWVFVDFQDPRMGTQAGLLRHILVSLGFAVPTPCTLERFLDIVGNGLTRPTVVLMDEIGAALQRYPTFDDEFWEGLRSLASSETGSNLAFMLAAHQLPAELAYASGHSSPFFNIFGYIARIGRLTVSEAHNLIDSSPLSIEPADVDWIITQSRCWPILLQVLCRERLAALQDDEPGDSWRENARQQMGLFSHLLEVT